MIAYFYIVGNNECRNANMFDNNNVCKGKTVTAISTVITVKRLHILIAK